MQRNEQLKNLIDASFEKVKGCPRAFDHNFLFVLGDLNFRVARDNKSARKAVDEKNYDFLKKFDELLIIMGALGDDDSVFSRNLRTNIKKDYKIMSELREGALNFPPSYKFDKGTLRYDSSKKP